MAVADWAIVGATLLGPILAVQAQKWVERAKEGRQRKRWVFETLMATRGARLSMDHVRALNMIDLSFYGSGPGRRAKHEQKVLDAWHEYLEDLGANHDFSGPSADALTARREELFINLLAALAEDCRLAFDRVQLKKSFYSPLAHFQIESEQQALRMAATRVFSGEEPLRVVAADSEPAPRTAGQGT